MTALLYLRVSTDEQAEKGSSLRDQKDVLEKYCLVKGYKILRVFEEDHSAKTFERPEFKKILEFIKHNKGQVEKLLVVRWDRFSRNMEGALGMIRQLLALGVEVESINQPLDDSVPENLLMKAFYLAAPQVENQRRSLNTINGMRRGIKEGRYVSRAPQGYLNKRDEQGKPILTIEPTKAPLIREMFELMATGEYTQQEVRRMMAKKGLNYCRTKFTDALRNVTYIGKLNLPTYKNEESEIITGIHEPIISETLFYRVQDVLNGKKRPKRYAVLSNELPLRGFLYCNGTKSVPYGTSTEHKMTGSCSKGHGGLYHYYHCANVNCERHRADHVNESYLNLLKYFKIDSEIAEVYEETVLSFFKPDKQQTNSIQQQIKAQEQRIQVLQDKLIDGVLAPDDYSAIKQRYESTLYELKKQLGAIALTESEFSLNFGNSIRLLTNLPEFYSQSDTATKREIIGSITPGKLYFENKKVRTSELNAALSLIATIDKGYSETHVLQKVQYEDNAPHGAPSGALVRTLQTDLASLSRLYKLVA